MQALWRQEALGAATAITTGFSIAGHVLPSSNWQARDLVWIITDASCGSDESLARALASLDPARSPLGVGLTPGPGLFHSGRGTTVGEALYLEIESGAAR